MNLERLAKVLAYVKANPKDWDQCCPDTAYPCCLLSRASIMSGRDSDPTERYTAPGAEWLGIEVGGEDFVWLFKSGRTISQVEKKYGLTVGEHRDR